MTITEMLTQIRDNYPLTEEETAFLNARIAQASKKSDRAPTAKQLENAEITKQIASYVTDKPVTASAIAKHFNLSTQRVTPMLTKLIADGTLTKSMVKRVNYYSAA